MSVLARRLRTIQSWQATLFVALVALGFLIAAQVRSEAPRVQYTSQERQPLIQTALGLQSQQKDLQASILALRDQIAAAESGSQGNDVLVRQLNDELLKDRIAAGLVALQGPGVVIQLEDSTDPVPPGGSLTDYLVSGRDVRAVVEELWLAGGEAVAVNDERIVVNTAILDIGGSILVNSAYLAGPYQVRAIGPADLYDRLAQSRSWQDFLAARAVKYGIRVAIAQPTDLVIPAYAGSVAIRYARPVASPPAPPAAP